MTSVVGSAIWDGVKIVWREIVSAQKSTKEQVQRKEPSLFSKELPNNLTIMESSTTFSLQESVPPFPAYRDFSGCSTSVSAERKLETMQRESKAVLSIDGSETLCLRPGSGKSTTFKAGEPSPY